MATRIPLSLLTEEKKDMFLQALHVKGEYNPWNDRDEKYVDCYRYNMLDGYMDVPFYFGKLFYRGLNINACIEKSKITVDFTGAPREEQVETIQQAKDKLAKEDTVLIMARPGFGKTFISVLLASNIGFTTLIVVNRIALLNQWSETITKYSNGKYWIFGTPVPDYKVDFVITMVDGLNKMDKSFLDRIGTLVVDEAHLLMTYKQVPAILRVKPIKMIFCTATPDRDKMTTSILNSFVLDHRVIKRYDGYLKVIKFYTGFHIEEHTRYNKGKHTLDWPKFVKAQSLHVSRNKQIISWIKCNLNRKIIVLTHSVNHSVELCKMATNESIDADCYCGNKKKYVDGNVLFGTMSKISTGFDPSGTEGWDGVHYDLLIMVSTMKALATIEQAWGRSFRSKFPCVVVMIDNNDKSEKHFKAMNKIVKMYYANLVESNKIEKIEYN